MHCIHTVFSSVLFVFCTIFQYLLLYAFIKEFVLLFIMIQRWPSDEEGMGLFSDGCH